MANISLLPTGFPDEIDEYTAVVRRQRVASTHYNGLAGAVVALEKQTFGAWVNVSTEDADPTGTTDSAAAIQAAIDSLGTTGGKVLLPDGDFLVLAALVALYENIVLEGAGRSATRILGGHTNGPVIRFQRGFSGIRRLAVYANATRLAGSAGTNYGVQFEAADVVDNISDRTRECFVDDCRVFGQPSHGVVMIGPVTNGSVISRSWIQANGGHGVVIDRGGLTSRSNLLGSGPSQIMVSNSEIHSNGGHAVACGSPTDTVATPSLRIVMDNLDTSGNATDSGVRYSLHEVWARGTNIELRASGLDGGGLRGGVFIAGRNHWLRNNRYINCTSSVQVGDYTSLSGFSTQGVNIEGLSVITLAQNPAVIIDSGATNVSIKNWLPSNVTSLVTAGRPGTQVEVMPQIVQKTADEVVSDSDTLQDDDDLKFYLGASEKIAFQCVIQHISASATPDIKVAFTVPSGASLRWGPSNSIKIDASDAVVAQAETLVSGTAVDFGSTTSRRQIVIEGSVQNGSTAGYLQLQWAQVTATAVNTTVYAIASHLKVWRKY